MTTSTFGTQTDIPADLPMRPRGARRSAAVEDHLFQEPAVPAAEVSAAPETPADDWAEAALQSLTAEISQRGSETVPESEAADEAGAEISQAEYEPAPEPEAIAQQPVPADADLKADIPGEEAARTARAAADAAALDLGLSSKSSELLHSLLVLSATDLSRGYPWRVHNMSARDWYEGFLFEDASSWLLGVGEAFSMRAFRTAMSGAEALAAFNSLSLLCLTPGVREETSAGVQALLADPLRIKRVIKEARI